MLRVEGLTKLFATPGGPVKAVDDVSFELADDEFFTMLGPSGCGKTTTLRMVAGLERASAGRVSLDGEDFLRMPAFRRRIGMVFQSYALFPHMTVFDNAAYGLAVRRVAAEAARVKVTRTLELLGLGAFAQRYPSELSGGQQQRVSIARALAYDPRLLLLDEPLANLDAKLRVEMREEIRRIQKELGIATLYVTHDQEEAMAVSDRLGVFSAGRLMQAGKPQDVYERPTSLFVADFIGKADLFPATVIGRDAAGVVVGLRDGTRLTVADVVALDPRDPVERIGDVDGAVMMRPEHVEIGPPDGPGLPCRIRRLQHLGAFARIVAECPAAAGDAIVETRGRDAVWREGATARLILPAAQARLFLRPGRA